jgi:hypothetical protein
MKDTEEGTNKEKVLHVYGLKKKINIVKNAHKCSIQPKAIYYQNFNSFKTFSQKWKTQSKIHMELQKKLT